MIPVYHSNPARWLGRLGSCVAGCRLAVKRRVSGSARRMINHSATPMPAYLRQGPRSFPSKPCMRGRTAAAESVPGRKQFCSSADSLRLRDAAMAVPDYSFARYCFLSRDPRRFRVGDDVKRQGCYRPDTCRSYRRAINRVSRSALGMTAECRFRVTRDLPVRARWGRGRDLLVVVVEPFFR